MFIWTIQDAIGGAILGGFVLVLVGLWGSYWLLHGLDLGIKKLKRKFGREAWPRL